MLTPNVTCELLNQLTSEQLTKLCKKLGVKPHSKKVNMIANVNGAFASDMARMRLGVSIRGVTTDPATGEKRTGAIVLMGSAKTYKPFRLSYQPK